MAIINIQFIERVNLVLEQYPASVTSLVRTPHKNASVGGVVGSKHVSGEAVDLVFDDASSLLPAAKLALTLGFGGIECDYRNNHLHLDNRLTHWHVVCTKEKTWLLKDFLTSRGIEFSI